MFQPLVQLLDLEILLGERTARMVRDRHVGAAAVAGCKRHLLERVLPVRPRRVAVELALDVRELDEHRQLTLARGLELARVLAQLRRDELVPEPLVDLGLARVA
jgi:hypothetical protein